MRVEGSQPAPDGGRRARETAEVERTPDAARRKEAARGAAESAPAREPHRAGRGERLRDVREELRGSERGPDRLELSAEALARLAAERPR